MPKFALIGLDSISLELLERYCSDRATPHLHALMRSGTRGRALSSLPAYTPTNWAALATAAHPGTTGASGWHRTVDGRRLSTFDRRAILCDTIWDACARQGLRSLAVQYPTAYPIRHPSCNDVLAPLDKGLVSCAIRAGRIFSSDDPQGPKLRPTPSRGSGEAGLEAELTLISREDLLDASNRAALAKKVGATEDGAEARETRGEALPGDAEELLVTFIVRPDGSAWICTGPDADELPLRERVWSDFIRCPVPTVEGMEEGIIRFKLLELDPERRLLRIAASEIYTLDRLASTPELSRRLFDEVGGYFEHSLFYPLLRARVGTERFPQLLAEMEEELAYQVDWIVAASRWMQERRPWDVYYLHWHFPDSVIHAYLPLEDPSSPAYDEALAAHARLMFEATFRLCDRLLGGLLELMDDQTTVLAVADHGNRVTHHGCNVMGYLASRGLVAMDAEGNADPSRSPVVLRHADFRWQLDVNTAGGAVPPEEYERTVNGVLEALLSWRNEESGENVVSLALRRNHAALLGLWGEEIGDVVFFYSDGYDWWGGGTDPPLASHGEAAHGPQLPPSRTSVSSNMPFFILRAPAVPADGKWEEAAFGQLSLIDLIATCCHLAGIDPPLDSAGAVRYRLLEETRRKQRIERRTGRRRSEGRHDNR